MFFSILTVLQFALFSFNVFPEVNHEFSDDINIYFPDIDEKEKQILKSKGRIDRYPDAFNDFALIPEISLKNKIREEIEKTAFNTAIESVFYSGYKTEAAADPGRDTFDNNNDNSDKIQSAINKAFAIITDIEGLSGITYYSISDKKEKILFTMSRILTGQITGKESSNIPMEHTITAVIEDTTFGINKYIIDYKFSDNHIVMKMSNLEKLKLGFIPVSGKNELVFHIAVIPAESGMFVYCSGICKTINAPFIRNRIRDSIYNRVTALYYWFSDNFHS